jgi:hypothetical protein
MDILRYYTEKDKTEIFAFELQDGNTHFPVLAEMLHNKYILEHLIDNGWKLHSFPYGFSKDGVYLRDYPHTVLELDDEQLGQMYDYRKPVLSTSELLNYISPSQEDNTCPLPTDFQIKTRDEFVRFINSPEFGGDDDYLPINYFVHPSARFTIDDYMSSKFAYAQQLNNRRNMSEKRLNKLIAWAGTSDRDAILKAYFAYGIDGVTSRFQVPVVTNTSKILSVLGGSENKHTIYGLIDTFGYTFPKISSEYVQNPTKKSLRDLEQNEYTVVSFSKKEQVQLLTLKCGKYTIKISGNFLMFIDAANSSRIEHSIICSELSPDLWGEDKKDLQLRRKYIHSLVHLLLDKFTVKCDVSSYKALTTIGVLPDAAVSYILNQDEDIHDIEGNALIIPHQVISEYMETGNCSSTDGASEDVGDNIESIISGAIVHLPIEKGKAFDAESENMGYFHIFDTANSILGVGLDDIYNQINSLPDTARKLKIQSDKGFIRTEIVKNSNAYNEYFKYTDTIRTTAARIRAYGTRHIWIKDVAVEVGTADASRHVGALYDCLEMAPDTVALLRQLEKYMESELLFNQREKYWDRLQDFSVEAFFNIVYFNRYFIPGIVDNKTGDPVYFGVPQKFRDTCRRALTPYYDSLYTLCSLVVDTYSNVFALNCVNADITLDNVNPRGNYKVTEVSFYAAFTNWKEEQPKKYHEFIEKGILPRNYKCWRVNYNSVGVADADIGSLYVYYKEAVNYFNLPQSERKYISAIHQSEHFYPYLFPRDNFYTGNSAPAIYTKPFCRLSNTKQVITYTDHRKLSKFKGYDAHDFYYKSFNAVMGNDEREPVKIDVVTQRILDWAGNEVTPDTARFRINHAHGNTYFLQDFNGQVWRMIYD